MKTYKYLLAVAVLAALWSLAGCDDKVEFSKDYDIPWIVSKISSVSPLQGVPGTRVIITGEHMGPDMVQADGVKMGTETCTIVSQTETSIVVEVPGFSSVEPVGVSVSNLHNRTYTFGEKFVPVLQ